ncbi:hypothetical protein C0145_06460 [Moraxella catarrhalis]|uniref:hypothetical protein n=1 Tax=Moraxella catarrhalis TaxID=480 RepID=UPI000202AFDC|nr:hypothetical protein [Moraxella catarrhalis]ARE65430.1 hypothetical protein MC195_01140 [Moraxella catarrhalis]EGE13203.1 hypothetical protein E9K_06506 [Moraxella catarrhalis 103P14B1]MPW54130.1 hypothetical protein [Moraxella catarrhalis]MPX54937.1 hypothetical protein [Moraxella catarrhalis]
MKIKKLEWHQNQNEFFAQGINQSYTIRVENKAFRLTITPINFGRPILQDAKTVEECQAIAQIEHELSLMKWIEK